MLIAQKIMVFVLFLSILSVLKEAVLFFLIFRQALRGEPGEHKYTLSKSRGLILILSLAYILTIITTGFKLF